MKEKSTMLDIGLWTF